MENPQNLNVCNAVEYDSVEQCYAPEVFNEGAMVEEATTHSFTPPTPTEPSTVIATTPISSDLDAIEPSTLVEQNNAVVALMGSAPQITIQPRDITVGERHTASFSVRATGNPTPHYQWEFWNGSSWVFAGSDSTLTIPNVTSAMNGRFYIAWAINSQGWAVSNMVTLTVTAQPSVRLNFIVSEFDRFNFGITSLSHMYLPPGGTIGAGNIPIPSSSVFGLRFAFHGWWTSPNGGTQVMWHTPIWSSARLYARIVREEITVSFHSNDGSPNPPNRILRSGDTLGYVTPPTRNGHIFSGWINSAGRAVTPDTMMLVTTPLLATWIPVPTFTVTFNANGGSVNPATQIVRQGDEIGSLPVAERQGYTFLGWFDSAGRQITATTPIFAATTLTARWERSEYLPIISSPYGTTRATLSGNSAYRFIHGNPANGGEYHHGIDTFTWRGNPLRSILDGGEVIFNGWIAGYGNTVGILYHHPTWGHFHTQYSHMNSASPTSVGTIVNRGDIVGHEGDSASPGSIHLHFAVYRVASGNDKTLILNPSIANVINPLSLYGIDMTEESINNSSEFILNARGVNAYTWELNWLNDFNENPAIWANRTHRQRPLNDATIVANMNRFFNITP